MRLSRRCYYVCVIACGTLGIFLLVLKSMNISLTSINPYPCSLYTLYGLYCPGCGGTRAVEYLMQGDLLNSFIYHPAVLYTVFLCAAYMITHTLNILSSGKIKAMLFRPIYFYIMIAIILLQCIIKNCLLLCFNINILS